MQANRRRTRESVTVNHENHSFPKKGGGTSLSQVGKEAFEEKAWALVAEKFNRCKAISKPSEETVDECPGTNPRSHVHEERRLFAIERPRKRIRRRRLRGNGGDAP